MSVAGHFLSGYEIYQDFITVCSCPGTCRFDHSDSEKLFKNIGINGEEFWNKGGKELPRYLFLV